MRSQHADLGELGMPVYQKRTCQSVQCLETSLASYVKLKDSRECRGLGDKMLNHSPLMIFFVTKS